MFMAKAKWLAVLPLCIVLISMVVANATQRLVLAEMFTSTTCGPCYNANLTLDQLINLYPDTFVVVRYHVWWPVNNDPFYAFDSTEIKIRTNYYGVTGIPRLKVDGYIDGGVYTGYWNAIRNRQHMESPMEITLSGSLNQATRQGALNINLTATDDAYYDSLYLRIALTESDLYYHGDNGVLWHDQTLRDMIPTAKGTGFDISYGQTVPLTQPFSVPAQLVIANCELVVWVQCDYMREIYQAARIPLTALDPVGIDDVADVPSKFSLAQNYPNPFNAQTRIEYSLASPSQVTLEIYDILGRKLETLVNEIQQPGSQSVIWDAEDMPSGIYFYRIQAGDFVETLKMNLMK
jgi:hypothetical protein